jgi:hypothetical protein
MRDVLFTFPSLALSTNGIVYSYNEMAKDVLEKDRVKRDKKMAFNSFLMVSNLAIFGNVIANMMNPNDPYS